MLLNVDEKFVTLCLALDSLLGRGSLVDIFFGNKKLYKLSEEFNDINRIKIEFTKLLNEIMFASIEDISERRKTYFKVHISALLCQIDIITDKNNKNYIDTVNSLFDISIKKPVIQDIEKLYSELVELLIQNGYKFPKDCIIEKWNELNLISGVHAIKEINIISKELKELTINRVIKPILKNSANNLIEQINIDYNTIKTDKGWSAYNFYEKNYHGNVSLNYNKCFNKMTLKSLVAHESYPGHHTEFAIREYRYNHMNYAEETAIAILNTPSCIVSEGIAENGLMILNLLEDEKNQIDMKYRRLVKEIQYYIAYNTYVDNRSIDIILKENRIISKVCSSNEIKRFLNFMNHWKYYVPVYKYGTEILEKCNNIEDLYIPNVPSYYVEKYK